MFRLRELGAIAAAGILLAFVFVPSMRKARGRAILGQCAAHAGQIGTALRTHANFNEGRLPCSPGPSRRWLPRGDQPAVSNSVFLFRLVKQGYA